jgi:hypothetical protein
VSSDMFKFMAAACPAMCGWCGNKVNIIKGDILKNNTIFKGKIFKGQLYQSFITGRAKPVKFFFLLRNFDMIFYLAV